MTKLDVTTLALAVGILRDMRIYTSDNIEVFLRRVTGNARHGSPAALQEDICQLAETLKKIRTGNTR